MKILLNYFAHDGKLCRCTLTLTSVFCAKVLINIAALFKKSQTLSVVNLLIAWRFDDKKVYCPIYTANIFLCKIINLFLYENTFWYIRCKWLSFFQTLRITMIVTERLSFLQWKCTPFSECERGCNEMHTFLWTVRMEVRMETPTVL